MKKRGGIKKSFYQKNKRIILIISVIFIITIGCVSYFIIKGVDIELQNKIAVIDVSGFIGRSDFGGDYANPEVISTFLEKANEDNSVKGIIIDINSPGGMVLSSELIANSIKKTEKPTVALIRDIGASGAYWVASACDKIVAYPMSITGSIGVAGSYLEFSGLMEKYGVTYNQLTAGEYKDTGSPYKKLSEKERVILMETVNKIYDYFIEQVSINRNLDEKTVRNLADGYIYLGYEAKNNGLIDYVGDRELAINVTKELAGIEDAQLIYYKQKKSVFDLLNMISSNSFYFLGKGIGSEIFTINKRNKLDITV